MTGLLPIPREYVAGLHGLETNVGILPRGYKSSAEIKTQFVVMPLLLCEQKNESFSNFFEHQSR